MRNCFFRLVSFFLLIVSLGCATGQKSNINEIPMSSPPAAGYEPSPNYGRVELPRNDKVEGWISYYTGRGRKHMERYLERSSRYIPMMKTVFREKGMPDELAYVALIESGFSSSALSHASAVGYWQFIRDTGKRYNLRIDPYVDERRDPILSTQAAAAYLDELYNLFGDWHLALASYNTGENRIKNAVMKKRSRNFWELASHRKVLHAETRNYVPKFIAAVYIAQDPERYGFKNVNFQPEFEFDSVVIDRPVSLDLLASELGVPYEEIKKMNPRYRSDFVPIYGDRTNAVRVPVGMKEVALAKLSSVVSEAPRIQVLGYEWYRIRKGDTLSGIAKKYRTNMARLRDLNDWNGKKTFIRAGQKIKVPEVGVGAVTTKKEKRSVQRLPAKSKNKVHIVRRGENLTTIAKLYRVSIGELTQANRLNNKEVIFVGKKLLIP